MTVRFFIIILSLFSPILALGSDGSQPIAAMVSFTGEASKKIEIRDALHKQVGSKLKYRAKNISIDQVELEHGSPLSSYEQLCERYRKNSFVDGCDIIFSRPPPDAVPDFGSVHRLESQIACDCCQRSPPDQLVKSIFEILGAIKQANKCDLVQKYGLSHEVTGLSPLWSQQQIGADIVRSELEKSKPNRVIAHAILDGGFDRSKMKGAVAEAIPRSEYGPFAYHGVRVANLLNSPSPYGISVGAKITTAEDGYSGNLLEAYDKIIGPPPEDIVTLEVHSLCELSSCGKALSRNGDVQRKIIGNLSKQSIVVAPAGNYYPDGSRDNILGNSNLIIVGSSNASGMVSSFSDESNDVTILAPTRERLPLDGISGKETFGQTSAAAPLVSGSLNNILQVLGDLNQNEAKKILQMTATKTAATEARPHRNGAGVLNAYKMYKVALRLKEKGWPKNREALLNDSAFFDFKDEAEKLLKEARDLASSEKCEDKAKAFLTARKSFLLNQSEDAATLLAEFYESQGYLLDANFYRNQKPGMMLAQLNQLAGKPPADSLSSNYRVLEQIAPEDARRNLRLLQASK